MKEEFDENAGSSGSAEDGHHASRNGTTSATLNGNSPYRRRKNFDFWSAAEILAHRWHWPIVCGILVGGAFFTLGWFYVQPKFTAVTKLQRYETPGISDFLKTSPLTPQTFSELLAAPDLKRRVGEKTKPPMSPDEISRRLKVDPLDESDIVNIYLTASTPQEAVELANLYSEESTNYTSQLQARQAAEVADTYLKQQVVQMDKDISDLTEQFRGMPGISQASNKLANAKSELNTLGQNPALSAQSEFMIKKLNEQLQSAQLELTQLLTKYTEQNPLVVAGSNKVQTLSTQLANAMGTKDGSTAAATITPEGYVVQPDLEVIKARLRSLEEARVTLEQHQHEAQLYASNPPGVIKLLAPAEAKTVRSGHRKIKIGLMTIFGSGVGVVFGLLLVFLIEITDRRVRTPEDIRRITKLPLLTTLGELQEMNEEEKTQWAFRTWTLLQGRLSRSQNHGLVCGITSSTAGEGRSTWIKMMAEAASLAGFRVLTIATKPSASPIEPDHQLTEETLDRAKDINGKDLHPAPNGANGTNGALTSSVLSTPSQVTEKFTDPDARPVVHIPLPGWVWNLERRKQWRDALAHWRKIENLVIFVELPPASVPESVLLGANLPNMVWMASSGKADAAETREQLDTLRHARCNIVGAVLNRAPMRPIRSYFPRWMTCLVLFTVLGLGAAQAQTSPPNNPVPTLAPQANPNPGGSDTNMTLLTEPPPDETNAPETHYSFSVVSPKQRAEWEKNLTLGPGDVLSFSLYGEPTLARNEVTIGPDGRISYLEAHDIIASGLTVDGLRQRLDDALGQFRRSPRTMITPVAYRSKKYYVLGKVVQRGVYTLTRPTTVLEALAQAKGIENGQVDYDVVDVADLQRAFLMRSNKRIPIDFEKLFGSGDLSQNVQIEPGDYLYFPSADVKQVYVLGEVALPGPVTFRPDLTMLGAISSRGGFNAAAFKSHVLVVRGSLNHPETFVTGLGTTSDTMNDFKLKPNDIIYVSWRPFYRGEELLDLAATAFVQAAVSGWVGTSVVKP
jgi:protein involved in polysaccharide export with SLBB domain/capsular polysaccharide biosynthesis protein